MANVTLKAVHAVYCKVNGKQKRVEPGNEFPYPEAEAEKLIEKGAATLVAKTAPAEPKKTGTKKAPAKKAAAAKTAEAPAAPAAEGVTPAATGGTEGATGSDEDLLS